MSSIKKLLGMLAGPHYKMERFCATFLVFALMLGAMFGMSLKIHVDHQKLTLGAQAKYTNTAQFSLSQDTFTVVDVYRDTNFTKAFVLLSSPTMENLPVDANDYKIFMTSYDSKHPLTCDPTAGIYIFGNMGFIGLYFADDAGFEPALYDVVLRNTRMIVQGDEATARANFRDESYWLYNQLHLYVNFAGSDAKIARFLDSDSPNVRDIYLELISESSADSVRAQLNETLLNMNKQMSIINEYSSRLSSYGLNVPALPASIAGDYITTDSALTVGNPSEFSTNMLSQGIVASSSQYNVTIDATDDEVYQSYVAGDTLYLVTDYVFPGGVQYNYQDINLNDNILDKLMPESLTYEQWTNVKTTEKNQYEPRTKSDLNFGEWTNRDGTRFVVSEYDVASKSIDSDIKIYEEAVRQLVSLKSGYQTQQLFALLSADASSRTIATVFSVQSNPNTITLY